MVWSDLQSLQLGDPPLDEYLAFVGGPGVCRPDGTPGWRSPSTFRRDFDRRFDRAVDARASLAGTSYATRQTGAELYLGACGRPVPRCRVHCGLVGFGGPGVTIPPLVAEPACEGCCDRRRSRTARNSSMSRSRMRMSHSSSARSSRSKSIWLVMDTRTSPPHEWPVGNGIVHRRYGCHSIALNLSRAEGHRAESR
jgi:hypothetical protein